MDLPEDRLQQARFSAPVVTVLGPTHPLYNIFRFSFPGVKRPVSGVDHARQIISEVNERVERVQIFLYSPAGPSWPVLGSALPLPYWYRLDWEGAAVLGETL